MGQINVSNITSLERVIQAVSPDSGFVFGAAHNIQADVPVENIIAMIEAFENMRQYSILAIEKEA